MKSINLEIHDDTSYLREVFTVGGVEVVKMHPTQEQSDQDLDEVEEFGRMMMKKYPTSTFEDTVREVCERYEDPFRRVRISICLGYMLYTTQPAFEMAVLGSIVEAIDAGANTSAKFAKWVFTESLTKGMNLPMAEVKSIIMFAASVQVRLECDNLSDDLPSKN